MYILDISPGLAVPSLDKDTWVTLISLDKGLDILKLITDTPLEPCDISIGIAVVGLRETAIDDGVGVGVDTGEGIISIILPTIGKLPKAA